MNIYETNNGVKPRFDGCGTEFGLMHRGLGPGFLMFDVDRLSAVLEVGLEMKREGEAFIEYRQDIKGIRFVAMFEVKAKKTEFSLRAMNNNDSSTMARNEMAKRLGCRLFVVYGTNGMQPFEFCELDFEDGWYKHVGILDYTPEDKTERVKDFWNNTLNIKRY